MSQIPNDADSILAAAIALGPTLREAADEIEQGRRLPARIVEAMKQAGIFRMAMPRAWGGPEVDPLMQLKILEALAVGDGSASWCAMIGIDGGYMTAFIDQDVGREMYRDLDAPTAATVSPPGRAEVVPGGYRATGRWPFGSGCQHSQWLVGNFFVYDSNSQSLAASGNPEQRFCFLPASDCEIHDTWRTTGLRGSGSHDWSVHDVFVPKERTFSFQFFRPYRNTPLYLLPQIFAYKLPGVALGIAAGAIEDFIAIAQRKQMTFSWMTGKPRMMRDEAFVQSTVAQAQALVGSARAYVFETMGELWHELCANRFPSAALRGRYRLAITHAHSACAQAVDLLYRANGGSSVYAGGPLDRRLRDIETARAHTYTSLKTYETAGRLILSLDALDPLF